MAAAASSSGAAAAASAAFEPSVVRSLYRRILKEVIVLDKEPVLKVLLPVPKKLGAAMGLSNQLYTPDTLSYKDVVRQLFREEKPVPMQTISLAFESLNTVTNHRNTLQDLLPRITQDHKPLVKALEAATQRNGERFVARHITVPRLSLERIAEEHRERGGGDQSAGGGPNNRRGSASVTVAGTRNALLRQEGFDIKAGMGLIAHPLSSAHIDRRVMIITDVSPQITSGLVLDMLYTYPLSHGNPMFPEVFWHHEVYNGGYCHVDYTMPPTANVSVLHTIPPPAPSSRAMSRFLAWATGQRQAGKGIAPDTEQGAVEHHELLCKPLIVGTPKSTSSSSSSSEAASDGSSSTPATTDGSAAATTPAPIVPLPTLYHSKVEALPYLASIAPGQPRSALRVYWGCMKWPTNQLMGEVASGHWVPVELSPEFFAAYPVNKPAAPPPTSSGAAASSATTEVGASIDCFPTQAMLDAAAADRVRALGADVSVPQTFPPDQPMCRREALWDQILYSLGGEYRAMVGSVNPFAARTDLGRSPPMVGGPSQSDLIPDGGHDDDE